MQDRKATLESLKTELLARVQRYEDHQHRINGALDKDLDEQALEVHNDEVVAKLEDEAEEELAQIERALARIDARVGDRCEECGNTITSGRLEALPYTTHCRDCADL
ncbi:TraR/DksA family transcriptional regulator [Vreelandella arcis]|uniref:Transcriptional regulator, TraR/DksA family n=1 Tax=Vreelandella arcis TaxID=416873 RepID=A0A1G9Z8I7_9GAMM|nr:TraR/DksA C4-type zinc finger protein [Halomonas arcis]SDN17868.1 transcriptional regulator, TraR/DksA family [Halomonas arcis]